ADGIRLDQVRNRHEPSFPPTVCRGSRPLSPARVRAWPGGDGREPRFHASRKEHGAREGACRRRSGMTRFEARGRARRAPLQVTLALALTALAAGPGQAAEPSPGAAAPKPPAELKIGITTNYPPIAFEENGQIVGVELDLARKLGEELPTKITFV